MLEDYRMHAVREGHAHRSDIDARLQADTETRRVERQEDREERQGVRAERGQKKRNALLRTGGPAAPGGPEEGRCRCG